MKRKEIVLKGILVFIVFVFSFFAFVFMNSVSSGIYSNFNNMVRFIFILLMFLILLVCSISLFSRNFKIENVYLISGITIGIIVTLLIPIGSVPDEGTHINMAYKMSNTIMGVEDTVNGKLSMRADDSQKYYEALNTNRVYLNEYYNDLFKIIEDDTIVRAERVVVDAPMYLYLFSGIGITFGRMLGFGTTLTFMLGRWFNMLLFVLMTFFSIKKLPFGKGVAFVWALLPIVVQQTSSFSYDCVINALCILIISLTMRLMYGDKYTTRNSFIIDCIVLFMGCLLLFPCKGKALLPVVVMPLMLLVKYVKDNWKDIKAFWDKKVIFKRIAYTAVIICVVICIIIGVRFVVGLLANADNNGVYVQWAQQYARPIGYHIKHFDKTLLMVFYTIWVNIDVFFSQMFGGYLGWINIYIPYPVTTGFMLLLIYAGIRRENETQSITLGNKIWMWFIFIGVCCISGLAMLLYWTPMTSNIIQGIQGRYFLPAMVCVALTLRTKKSCVSKDADRVVVSLTTMMYVFVAMSIVINK